MVNALIVWLKVDWMAKVQLCWKLGKTELSDKGIVMGSPRYKGVNKVNFIIKLIDLSASALDLHTMVDCTDIYAIPHSGATADRYASEDLVPGTRSLSHTHRFYSRGMWCDLTEDILDCNLNLGLVIVCRTGGPSGKNNWLRLCARCWLDLRVLLATRYHQRHHCNIFDYNFKTKMSDTYIMYNF